MFKLWMAHRNLRFWGLSVYNIWTGEEVAYFDVSWRWSRWPCLFINRGPIGYATLGKIVWRRWSPEYRMYY